MPCDEMRTQKITERSQVNVNGGVVDKKLEIEERCKGKTRRPYGKRTMRGEHQVVLRREELIREVDGERYVVLDSGNWLPERWLDMYEWFLGGKAPGDWISRLRKTAPSDFKDDDYITEMNSKLV